VVEEFGGIRELGGSFPLPPQ